MAVKKKSSGPEVSKKLADVKVRTTPWVKRKLELLASSEGPFPRTVSGVADQFLRERLGELFAGELKGTLSSTAHRRKPKRPSTPQSSPE